MLDLPAEPPEPAPMPAGLAEALGVRILFAGRNRFDWLVEVDSEATVRGLSPDMALLGAIHARGVIVTSRSGTDDADFVSRFFAPAVGIPEDPVCGSAHCCLGPFWAGRLGKEELVGHQVSARGGVIRVRPMGPRIEIGGQAVTVLRGELV